MHVVIAGASGFIGTHLTRALEHAGHTVTQLVRRAPRVAHEAAWEPAAGILPSSALDGADAVVNLCGAGIGDRRWTSARKRVLWESRIPPTDLLARACVRAGVPTLISASAVGYYGDRGDDILVESDGPGNGFVPELCHDWETATAPASDGGVRVVPIRTGLVLGPDGGMLPRLRLLTRALLAGRLGSGHQWWPWVSIVDHVAATIFAIENTALRGPVNVVSPNPVSNAEFTSEMGKVLHRPTPWRIPRVALRVALGQFAGEILASQRVIPAALSDAGFEFLQPELHTALRAWAP